MWNACLLVLIAFWIVSGCVCACLPVSWYLFHATGSSLMHTGVAPARGAVQSSAWLVVPCTLAQGAQSGRPPELSVLALMLRDFESACSNCETSKKHSDRRCLFPLLLRSSPQQRRPSSNVQERTCCFWSSRALCIGKASCRQLASARGETGCYLIKTCARLRRAAALHT